MPFQFKDFLIGVFLMNAMPHMLFAMMNIRFLTLFGFSGLANLLHALISVGLALYFYHVQYHISTLIQDGVMVGALSMLLIFLLTSRFLLGFFELNHHERGVR